MDKKYLIHRDSSIIVALKRLDGLSSDILTLLVIDGNNRLVGTLTDGDIRRGIIRGVGLNEPISTIMNKSFFYLSENDSDNVKSFDIIKRKGVQLLPVVDKCYHVIDTINLKQLKSILPIDVILMAGGKGIRLRPLTENTPKPLLKLGDRPIIDYNIQNLESYGIKHISVTVNYLKEQLIEHFSSKHTGARVNCVVEKEFLGTIGSVRLIKKFFNDTVLVMNSDLFTNINFADFYQHFIKYDADLSVATVPYSISVPYGVCKLSGNNIMAIREKPTFDYYANAGIYLIKKEVLKMVPAGSFYNATDLINMLIDKKKRIIKFPITGYWIDIGKHEDYAKAQEILKHI